MKLLDLSTTSVVDGEPTCPIMPFVSATAVTLVIMSLHRSTPENVKLYITCVGSVTVSSIGGSITPPTTAVALYMSTHTLPVSAAFMSTANVEGLSGRTVNVGAEAGPV